MINPAVDINDKPLVFRYPRGNGVGVSLPLTDEIIIVGKGGVIIEGKNIVLLNFGARLKECVIAEENLKKKGINLTIIDARFCKPLDENLIWQVATDHDAIITIEEGSIGGFGSHVGQFLADKNLLDNNLKYRCMILPDRFIDHDKPELMYKFAGLDDNSIESKVLDTLNSKVIIKKTNLFLHWAIFIK
jgi:Deoxyxylulose-5-phosphate synthase